MLLLLKDILMWLVFVLVLVLILSISHTILVILGIVFLVYIIIRVYDFLIEK